MIKYMTPELEKLAIDTEDVILASVVVPGGGTQACEHTYVNGVCTKCNEPQQGNLPDDEF